MSSEIKDEIACVNPDAMLADGFDDALIGYAQRAGIGIVAMYDSDKCIEILLESGMDEEEAMEYFEFNVVDAYCGEYTPVFATLLRNDT